MRTSKLPPIVRPTLYAPVRLNCDATHVRLLAAALNEVPMARLFELIPAIIGFGIMYLPLVLRVSIAIGVWRTGFSHAEVCQNAFYKMASRKPDRAVGLLHDIRMSTVKHILYGVDHEDDNSIGGLSKREMQSVANMVEVGLRQNTSPLGMYMLAGANDMYEREL